MDHNASANYATFRDCFSELVINKLSPSANEIQRRVKGRKNEIKPITRDTEQEAADSLEELSDFIEVRTSFHAYLLSDPLQYVATEIFECFPVDFQTLSYRAVQDHAPLKDKYSVPLDTVVLEDLVSRVPATTAESLSTYGLLDITDEADLVRILEPILESYVTASIAVPPENDTLVQADECEMCERDQLPLTYHHLIPRAVHAKAVKRGWAKEWELQKVAWLCRACHSFVHRMASNEELAKEWHDMDDIMEREDVQAWAQWVRKVRWKKR